MKVTPGLTGLLGVQPVLGRVFTADDARAGAPSVALMSYAMWQREYGGARDVLGRAITLDEVARTVIGVMPPRWGNVLHLVVAQAMRAAVAGVAVGVLGALGLTKLLTALLYGVAPRDPWTFLAVGAILLVVALAASWLPARRATQVDPIIALRAE